mgnify:CR=1 FL=1
MIVHSTLERSRANGPGERFVLWVQGCARRCPGCYNPDTHASPGTGRFMTPSEIADLMPEEGIDGVTVSGGEPFDQAAALAEFLAIARARGLHTLVYTGYRYAELAHGRDRQGRADWGDALELTDALVDGPFVKGLTPKASWTGSGNQRYLVLERGQVIWELGGRAEVSTLGEVIIAENGDVITTGILGCL